MFDTDFNLISTIVIVIVSIIIVVCSIGIVIAVKFQKKQNQKYLNCLEIIKNKEGAIFEVKNGLTKEDINKIDKNIDVDKLMSNLYDTYIDLENKLNLLDSNLNEIVISPLKDFYKIKINQLKRKNYIEITDGIELISYSIIDFSFNELKFRIIINCFNYKKKNGVIFSGSNLKKIQKILILTYKKVNEKWLISDYEKVSEKNLDK